MSGALLVTGATGLVGGDVAFEAARAEPDRPIFALVRAADEVAATERLVGEFRARYGPDEAWPDGLRGLPGDLSTSGLGLTPANLATLRSEVSDVVHCAASVRFDLPIDEARAVNLAGAERLARLSMDLPHLDHHVHVSTAYVAGDRSGRIAEDETVPAPCRNTYEQSKQESELWLREHAAGLPLTIVRPSIIVGQSDTGWTTSFNVLYRPLRAFASGLLRALPLDPESRLDVVPLDHVRRGIERVLEVGPGAGVRTFHVVAGDAAISPPDLAELAGRVFDAPAADGAPSSDDVARLGAFAPYLGVNAVFDDSNTREVLGLTAPSLEDYFERLVDFALAARWGKRALTKDAALDAPGFVSPRAR